MQDLTEVDRFQCHSCHSPRHKHWPAGPAHFSDRRASPGQYILSFTGTYGPPIYMSGHQISNSGGPNDDKSQYVLFARAPVPHLGSFRAVLLLQRDACVTRVGVRHVNHSNTLTSVFRSRRTRYFNANIRYASGHFSPRSTWAWFRVNSFAFWSINLKY